jgi:hypothetical protein
MLFSEMNQDWEPIPKWMEFLIRFGKEWPSDGFGQRRIALISMPCDSPAAGLIALGSLIRDLGNPNANDIAGHYDHLLRYARQYLESCRSCGPDCKPDVTRCGYIERASGRLHSPLYPRKSFTIAESTDIKKRQLAWHYPVSRGQTGIEYPSPKHAIDWHIDGQPPLQRDISQGQLPAAPYGQLTSNSAMLSENLSLTWSGLCLAGRVKGETATREMCESIRFQNGRNEYTLPELLTVYGWAHSNSISRMTFFNPRIDQLDRQGSLPLLVVSDGDACFLKVLVKSEFQRSDVIGVIHRTIERDSLELIGSRMIGLRQWYMVDSETLETILPAPRGISVSILKKRTT